MKDSFYLTVYLIGKPPEIRFFPVKMHIYQNSHSGSDEKQKDFIQQEDRRHALFPEEMSNQHGIHGNSCAPANTETE